MPKKVCSQRATTTFVTCTSFINLLYLVKISCGVLNFDGDGWYPLVSFPRLGTRDILFALYSPVPPPIMDEVERHPPLDVLVTPGKLCEGRHPPLDELAV